MSNRGWTAAEFKAWFEGFCEGIREAPDAYQWNLVKDKVYALEARDFAADVRQSLGMTTQFLAERPEPR